MKFHVRNSCGAAALALLPLLIASPRTAAAQAGSVVVKVTEARTGRPVDQAQISIVGTTLGALTSAEGTTTVRGVPAGIRVVRVIRVGYTEQKKSLNVPAAQPASVEFALEQVPINLAPVVTTATGEVRRVELGSSVTSLNVAKKMETVPIKTIADALVAKAPGVQVLPNNMTGAGSRIRIRGTSSLSLSNDPIYIIDGIRMTTGEGNAIGVGGTTGNRANDISPDEIENIEIVKGPSAATLYGTDAANGVIVITTKKGRAGRAEWTTFFEQGLIKDRNDYPTQYALLGHTAAAPGTPIACFLKDISLGTCIKDSTSALNIFSDPETSMIDQGHRNLAGLQLRGGTEAIRYFASGDVENETGVFKLPDMSVKRLDSLKVGISPDWNRPNALQKVSFRTNLNTAVSPQIDLAIASNFIRLNQRLPQVDNNVNSFFYNGSMGPGFKGAGPTTVGPYTGIGSLGQPLRGYANGTPTEIFQDETKQSIQRIIGSANADWRPLTWMQNRADFGVDLTDRVETELCRFRQCYDFSTQRDGRSRDNRTNIRNISTNITSTMSYGLFDWASLKTTVGTQYGEFYSFGNQAQGQQLTPGAETPGDGVIPSASQTTTLTKTLGLYIEESAALRDRLFLTAAIRTDQNSAFGTNFQRVYYPKASLSYIISDESFFPKTSWLNQVRLRSAIGSSGVQPGPNDALRTFSVVTTNIGNVDIAGLRSNALGNLALKPERATEIEFGMDTRLINSRVNLDVTYYNKRTKDALVDLTIAPSAGSSATSQKANLGAVRNTGFEALLNTSLLDRRAVGWDVTVSASHNSNELITLGFTPSGKPVPPIIGTTTRQAAGYPLNGYWSRPYTWSDANGDGIITPNEVIVNGGTADTSQKYLGYSQPRLEVSITNGIDLLNRRLRITVLADHKGGSKVLNSETQFLCQQRANGCFDITHEEASLWRQARGIANRFTSVQTSTGYIEQNQFWRLREVSMTYSFSEDLAAKLLRGRGGSITAAVRNLHVWTNWTGVDPEQNYGQGSTQQTLLTAGPPMYATVRVNVRY